jgi:hypothetical protein
MIIWPRRKNKTPAQSAESNWQDSLHQQEVIEAAPTAMLIHLWGDQDLNAELRSAIKRELRWRLEEILRWVEAEVDAR